MENEFVSHRAELEKEVQQAAARALEIIGGKAETYAKLRCRVRTGLLRNSITHALDGGEPSISEYKADKGDGKGSYKGHAPKEGAHKRSVTIGSNVFYAIFNELGTKRDGEEKMTAQPFLRPAIENHIAEYKEIIETELDDSGINNILSDD